MLPIRKPLYQFGLGLVLSASYISFSQTKQNVPRNDLKTAATEGRSTFNSTCAGCHGLDGGGSDKAVNISGSAKVKHFSDAQLSSIISNGVPGTGMPAFHALSEKQVRSIVGYLRVLQGKGEERTLPGDAKRGKEIFFGKGDCSSCHMISGEGGFLGPDLTDYAATATATAIRDEIVKSPRSPSKGYRAAAVTTANGDRLEGLIRNEDNFSVQLQTGDGNFHVFKKAELSRFEPLSSSMMRASYRELLSDGELNDLVSYLMKTPDPNKVSTPRKNEGDFE